MRVASGLRGHRAPEPRPGARRLRRLEPRARLPLRREGRPAGPPGRRASRRRLVREGELLLELAHPHIVRAYELRRRAPHPVLVLETLGGETLEHMIQSAPRRLAIADVAHLGLQLCSAIGYLHGHGYLHLDLKPSNVIVAERPGAG